MTDPADTSHRAPAVGSALIASIAPTGVLRAGINLSNFLLVNDRGEGGEPIGVSPSLAASLAGILDVGLDLVALPNPGDVVDAVVEGMADIGNIGADPARAEHLSFTAPYAEIEATYLVREGSPITTIDEVDVPGVRIASRSGAAYTLWLDRNIQNARVLHAPTIDESLELFVGEGLEVLAGLRPRLLDDVERVPGSRLLEGRFTGVMQAIAIRKDRGGEAISFLDRFVRWAITSGLVADLIGRHGVSGLSVANPGTAPVD